MKYRLKPSFGQKLWANVNGRMFIFYANRYESYPDNVVEFYADVLEPETAPKPKAKAKPQTEASASAYNEVKPNDC